MDHNFKDILHNVNLTEGQISVILNSLEHTMDRWEQSGYYCEEDQKAIDSVFQELGGALIGSMTIWKRNNLSNQLRSGQTNQFLV